MNSDDDVRQKTGSTHGMADDDQFRRPTCAASECDVTVRSRVGRMMDEPRCTVCRGEADG